MTPPDLTLGDCVPIRRDTGFMGPVIEMYSGSTLAIDVDVGIDLMGVVITVFDCSDPALEAPSIEITDEGAGIIRITWTDESLDGLKRSNIHYFRIRFAYLDGTEQTTTQIRIDVK